MSTKNPHRDQIYINGLVANDSIIIKEIYNKYVPKVVNYIKNNSGDEFLAKDLIQEVLVTIYHQGKDKKLQLTCPFDAYFFLLCKRKWLNELKKPKLKKVTINEEIVSKGDDAEELADETFIFSQKQELFNEMFQQLGKACQDLLKATFKIKSMEEVAASLGFTYAYVRKKKSLCIGELTNKVRNAPNYNNLF
ncbi:sigma-70 family RNA polymerase sigma factor [Cellulophaga sp. F20128]|uniref:RNA polymerase sigma factor n=1 Tax=Cellulophaga sp. F20128 TaxID=2926413 RepID=UPI001FF126ED|nr:sigma-70 family RNA polymerase sigma factor [Cellulophaga sp. F20128]MCK0156718.1 sigma-70 family RNA polymerase sigma factor [Cellulophaga sp. F20128]